MKMMRTVLAVLVVAGLTASARAEDKADTKKLLVGKWEAVKVDEGSLPKGATVELTKDGKVKVAAKTETKEIKHDGTYVVDGNSFTVTLDIDGNERSYKVKIIKISDTEMDTANEEGKKVSFRKVK